MPSWSDHLRRYRRLNALTQVALAEMLGVEQATVSRWERGTHQPELAIQRRLRDLLHGQELRSDQIVFHRVHCSFAAMKIADRAGQNHAASQEAARLHGVAHEVLSKCNYRLFFTEIVEQQWKAAVEKGFFGGEIASIRVSNSWQPASLQPPRYCRSYWTPIRLSDGEILLLSEFVEIEEPTFLSISSQDRFVVTFMDELVC